MSLIYQLAYIIKHTLLLCVHITQRVKLQWQASSSFSSGTMGHPPPRSFSNPSSGAAFEHQCTYWPCRWLAAITTTSYRPLTEPSFDPGIVALANPERPDIDYNESFSSGKRSESLGALLALPSKNRGILLGHIERIGQP